MIQQAGLFPHRTVADNIATVPRLLGWDKAPSATRVESWSSSSGCARDPRPLPGRAVRRPAAARRRRPRPRRRPAGAAHGRALRRGRPDRAGRACRTSCCALQRRVGKTIVLVTHDIDEAIKLGDRVALLDVGGVLEQFGPPDELLRSPASAFVESFLGRERSLRRMALLTPHRRLDLGARSRRSIDDLPTIDSTAGLREALDILVATGSTTVVVLDPGGHHAGSRLVLDALVAARRAGRGRPRERQLVHLVGLGRSPRSEIREPPSSTSA